MASGPIHFEGFHVGDRFETLGRTVSEYEILSFVNWPGGWRKRWYRKR